MSLNLERRIERLEMAASATNLWAVIVVHEGEDEGEAVANFIAAHGLRQRPGNILFIVR